MIVTKPIDLTLLQQEMAAVGVHLTLGMYGGPIPGKPTQPIVVHTYDAQGLEEELPPEAVPVVNAHVAPPRFIEHAATRTVDAVRRTTDAALTEVFRFPTTSKQVYKGVFEMMAVDAVSGATKNTEARMTFKRTQAALVQVGTTAIPYNAPDTATASWAIVPSVDGTDLVISVSGAVGRTVDWILKGTIGVYAPEGL